MLTSTAELYGLRLRFSLAHKTLEKRRANQLGAVGLHGNVLISQAL